jgi:hypothetical protein
MIEKGFAVCLALGWRHWLLTMGQESQSKSVTLHNDDVVNVARSILYLYNSSYNCTGLKVGDFIEWDILRIGPGHAEHSLQPPDLVTRSQGQVSDGFRSLIPDRVSLYAFADKYPAQQLQKLVLDMLFDWKENLFDVRWYFWEIVQQLRDACPVSDELKVKVDDCLCSMKDKERNFINCDVFWKWLIEWELAERIFRPFLSEITDYRTFDVVKKRRLGLV